MNYFILIFFSIILPIISLKQIKQKLCIDCKHFIPDNIDDKFGKCSLFEKKTYTKYFLVNGINEDAREYHYCATSRNEYDMCGEEGKYYKKKMDKK